MKHTIEFNLPEERVHFQNALKADTYAEFIDEISNIVYRYELQMKKSDGCYDFQMNKTDEPYTLSDVLNIIRKIKTLLEGLK